MSENNLSYGSDQAPLQIPLWFWITGGVALLWNLMGVAAFVAECMMSEEALDTLSEEMQALYRDLPMWYYAAFGFAVFAGAAGSLALLVRSRWAVALFGISLVGLLFQQSYQVFLSDVMQVAGAGAMIFQAIVLIVDVGLLILALVASQRRWLR